MLFISLWEPLGTAALVPEPKIKAHHLTNTRGGLCQMRTVLEHPCCILITAQGYLSWLSSGPHRTWWSEVGWAERTAVGQVVGPRGYKREKLEISAHVDRQTEIALVPGPPWPVGRRDVFSTCSHWSVSSCCTCTRFSLLSPVCSPVQVLCDNLLHSCHWMELNFEQHCRKYRAQSQGLKTVPLSGQTGKQLIGSSRLCHW